MHKTQMRGAISGQPACTGILKINPLQLSVEEGVYKMPASLDARGAADVAGAEGLVRQAALQQP